jgi:hypothetical protein
MCDGRVLHHVGVFASSVPVGNGNVHAGNGKETDRHATYNFQSHSIELFIPVTSHPKIKPTITDGHKPQKQQPTSTTIATMVECRRTATGSHSNHGRSHGRYPGDGDMWFNLGGISLCRIDDSITFTAKRQENHLKTISKQRPHR